MALFEAQHIKAVYHRDGKVFHPFTDVSFSLEPAKVYDLVGPSGSGKSTLLRVCARMLNKDGGTFLLEGKPETAYAPTQWRRRVCLVPQQSVLVNGTVRDNLVYPWKLKINEGTQPPDDKTLKTLLEMADLPDIELSRDASQLSGGQLARVALLRAFATRPVVLLLDEVDAALDAESAHAIGKLTKALVDEKMTCLRVRHRSADGYAFGTFTLADGVMSYADNKPTDENAPNTEGGSLFDALKAIPDTEDILPEAHAGVEEGEGKLEALGEKLREREEKLKGTHHE